MSSGLPSHVFLVFAAVAALPLGFAVTAPADYWLTHEDVIARTCHENLIWVHAILLAENEDQAGYYEAMDEFDRYAEEYTYFGGQPVGELDALDCASITQDWAMDRGYLVKIPPCRTPPTLEYVWECANWTERVSWHPEFEARYLEVRAQEFEQGAAA